MVDPALLKFVARAHAWWEQIRSGSTLGQLAGRQGVTKRFIGLHLPAAFLAPDILELIIVGRQPISLTAQALRTHAIPQLWEDQRTLFGLSRANTKSAENALLAESLSLKRGRNSLLSSLGNLPR